MNSRRHRRARRDAMLADSAQVGLLGYPQPTSEADALRLAMLTLHGVRAYAARSLRELDAIDADGWLAARELRKRIETVESHCRNVLASMAAFDQEESP